LSSVNTNEVIWWKNKTKEEEEFEKNILIVIHYF
jgi:hypothetical protein